MPLTNFSGVFDKATTKTISFPLQTTLNNKLYLFKQWSDGDLNHVKTITINSNLTLNIWYEEDNTMGNVMFNGSLTNQEAEGQTITISITLPDTSIVTLSTVTQTDKTFSINYTGIAGDYSAKASIQPDTVYTGAESASVPFTIGLIPRTITLTVV